MEQFTLKKYLQDPTRKIITREGKPVRIICTDRRHPVYKVVALVPQCKLFEDSNEVPIAYSSKGEVYAKFEDDPETPNNDDLFFAPTKQSRWVFLYNDPINKLVTSKPYTNKESAIKDMKKYNGFGLTEITWEV